VTSAIWDEDGFLFLPDGRHHMINLRWGEHLPQGGEDLLVHPSKVSMQRCYRELPTRRGQSVKGVVQPVDTKEATEAFADELLAWLREAWRTTNVRAPFVRATVPRTDTGKLYKQELVEKYLERSA